MMHGDAVRCRRWIKRSSRRVSASDMDPLFSSRIIHSDIFVRRIRLDSTRPGQLSGDLRIRSCRCREEQRISVRCAPPHGNDSEIISTHIWEWTSSSSSSSYITAAISETCIRNSRCMHWIRMKGGQPTTLSDRDACLP